MGLSTVVVDMETFPIEIHISIYNSSTETCLSCTKCIYTQRTKCNCMCAHRTDTELGPFRAKLAEIERYCCSYITQQDFYQLFAKC